MAGSSSSEEHLSADLIGAYLDRMLSSVERDEVEGHLSWCRECRLAAREAAQAMPKRGSGWYVFAGVGSAVAAAAAIALFVMKPAADTHTENQTTRSSAPSGANVPAIAVVSPSDSAALQSAPVSFVWRALGPDVPYRFSLSTTDGTELWGGSLTDTVVTLPAGVELLPGETYVWFVDALLPDGRSATTGLRLITIRQ